MPEEIKDVNTETSSNSEEQVVNQEQTATDQQTETVEEGQTQETSTQEVKQEVRQTPDRPEINYAMEAARKASEALEIARQLQQQQQQVQQQPQYSKAQLRAFAEQTQDPTQKVWALEEIDKLDKAERTSEMRQLFEGYTKKTQEETTRQQATRFVSENFPECFVKDAQGNTIGWDNNSPLTRRIGEYMQNPAIAQNPDGLVAAAKMAAFDLGISMNRKLQNKINTTTAQLRREQKKQLITGVGTQAQTEGASSKQAKLAEEYRKTGNREVFKQLAKAKGLIPEL